MALIRTARQALQADRPARALEVLDAHARAFPAGQMREDRQVLRIEALCAAGKAPQARAEVALFLRAFPGSAHAQRVRASCAAR
jgi:outer membrane protein assembly factor BamD (BamD/ComL family)